MRVIQEKKTELVLLGDMGVITVPNNPYFSLKYNDYAGNKITYVISQKPEMKVFEGNEKEFTCQYNKMEISITTSDEVNKLCGILLNHQKNNDTVEYVNFFCGHFAEQNQESILDVFFAPYANRITKDVPCYTIDGVFGIDRWGNAYVNNPEKKNFPWQEISLEISSDVQEFKIISSFDGQDLIMDADLQRYVTKVFYLLNAEKKDDAMFMVQLPKKVQRWVENGDTTAPVRWDSKVPEKEEKVFVPKCYGFFPTPPQVVQTLIENADLEEGMKILEPSAGQGNILELLKDYDVTCGELYSGNRSILEEKGFPVLFDDFMEYAEYEKYDRLIMNPPFAKQEDIDHVLHGLKMLKKGGRLVSIMASSIQFRDNKKSKRLREIIEKDGYIIELPQESFKESGTNVNTVIVVIDK